MKSGEQIDGQMSSVVWKEVFEECYACERLELNMSASWKDTSMHSTNS
jgi:hypothetical protein